MLYDSNFNIPNNTFRATKAAATPDTITRYVYLNNDTIESYSLSKKIYRLPAGFIGFIPDTKGNYDFDHPVTEWLEARWKNTKYPLVEVRTGTFEIDLICYGKYDANFTNYREYQISTPVHLILRIHNYLKANFFQKFGLANNGLIRISNVTQILQERISRYNIIEIDPQGLLGFLSSYGLYLVSYTTQPPVDSRYQFIANELSKYQDKINQSYEQDFADARAVELEFIHTLVPLINNLASTGSLSEAEINKLTAQIWYQIKKTITSMHYTSDEYRAQIEAEMNELINSMLFDQTGRNPAIGTASKDNTHISKYHSENKGKRTIKYQKGNPKRKTLPKASLDYSSNNNVDSRKPYPPKNYNMESIADQAYQYQTRQNSRNIHPHNLIGNSNNSKTETATKRYTKSNSVFW